MKKIGLVGGTGPESTLMYYKELNSRIDEMKIYWSVWIEKNSKNRYYHNYDR